MLRPIKSKVIVELIKKEKVSSGGILLADVDPNEANKGLVIAIGPEVLDVEVGQTILANWNAAEKIKYEDSEYYIVPEEQIVLVFES